jgi:uncharacterized protein (DUF885 family)
MKTRSFIWLFAGMLPRLVLSAPAAPAVSDADALLNAFFGRYFEDYCRQHPVEATQLGEHRFDSGIEDLSPAARAAWQARLRRTLAELPRAVPYRKLSRPAQVDFEIFQHDLLRSLWLEANTRPFEQDPRTYGGYLSESVYLLLAQSSLPKETNVANCLARMALLPRVVAAARENLRNPPRPHLETAIQQNRGAIAFYEKEIFDLAGDTAQLDTLKTAARQAAAVLKGYQDFLEQDLRPRAHGEWRLGRAKFYQKLELELDAGLNADQVLADARTEFARVEREMWVVARQLWSHYFPGKPVPPDDADGRRSMIAQVLAQVGQEHDDAAKLVSDVQTDVENIKRFIAANDIVRLPDPDLCQVVEMPEFQRGNSTAFMNAPPPLDPKAAGYYAVSPPPRDWDAARVRSYLEEYNRHLLQILTIHEAYPGHYVQLEYANRQPSPIRRVLQSGVYIEGWAVYGEQMMLDQGYGDGNLALRLSQLKFYLRAVANTILDHQMHCTAMTDAEAMDFLVRRAFQSEGEARLKLIRAKQSSVQLSTYFVGRMAMYRLRQAVEREWGDRFSLGRYHEAVLAPGAVPVKYLPELVRTRLALPR